MLDDVALLPSKSGITKDFVEDLEGARHEMTEERGRWLGDGAILAMCRAEKPLAVRALAIRQTDAANFAIVSIASYRRRGGVTRPINCDANSEGEMPMSAFDAIIVGGGPAGASCALWLNQLRLRPCIVERRPTLGGLQNESISRNDWIAPVVDLRGEEVARSMHVNVLSHGIACHLSTSVESVTVGTNGFIVDIVSATGKNSLSAPYLVLASGVHPADGGLRAGPNLIVGPGKQIAERDFRGKSVAVLGGGDSAFENYEFIRAKGPAGVHIHARSISARREFLERIPVSDVSFGPYEVDPDELTVAGVRYDVIAVFYGWTPSLEFTRGLEFARDAEGFVVTDRGTAETSIPNLFAIGEVAQRMHPCCVTSMADGVVAAKQIQRRIEAGAQEAFIAAVRAANRRRAATADPYGQRSSQGLSYPRSSI
jgi:thioredoxin reductase